MESLQGRIDLFNNSLQTLYNNTLKSDWIKWFVDRGTDLVQVLDTAYGKILALIAAIKLATKIKNTSILGVAQGAAGNVKNVATAKNTLDAFGSINLLGASNSTAALQQYAAAVADLTAKQQANLLASAGLSKQQIQMAMQYNGLEKKVINEATAHVFAKGAKDQEAATDANLLRQKTQMLAASYQAQAAKLQEAAASQTGAAASASEAAASEATAAANWLEANSSNGVTLAKVQEAISSGTITAATGAEIIAKLGLARANTTLLGTIKALFASNPVGWIIMGISLLLTFIPLIKSLIPTTEDLIKEWEDTKNAIAEVNTELETTQRRISELEGKGSLSIVEQEELRTLRQTNDELKRRKRLLEEDASTQADKAQKQIEKDYKKDFQDSYGTNSVAIDDSIIAVYEKKRAKLLAQRRALAAQGITSGQEYVNLENQINKVEYLLTETARISKEDWIDKATERYNDIAELLQSKDLTDEEAKSLYDERDTLKAGLTSYASEIYQYLDDYDGKNQKIVQHWNDILSEIDMTINPIEYKPNEFNKILDKYSKQKEELAKLALQGELTADTLNGADYSELVNELNKIGIGAESVVKHFNAMAPSMLNQIADPDFNISDYSDSISSLQDNISSLEGALSSLESGSFTYSDFIELTKTFPELADGVDTASGKFEGLTDNIIKLLKESPKELINELNTLRKRMVAAGKDTTYIDQITESIKKLPSEAVSELSGEFGTLADKMLEANNAQGELAKAMSEEPNKNYKNTSEALQEMQKMIEAGMVGSGSKAWDIFEALTGKTYDYTKSLEENVEVMKDWAKTRSKWFLGEDDDEYARTGLVKFLNDAEAIISKNEKLKDKVTWIFDGSALNIDFDRSDWDDIAEALGITEEMFSDLMVQVSQFFEVNWDTAGGLLDYLQGLSEEGKSAKEQFDTITPALQNFLGKYNLTDEELSKLLNNEYDISNLPQELQDLLNAYYNIKNQVENDPLEIIWKLNQQELSDEQKKIADQMQKEYDQTPIDLTLRPNVSWEDMHKAGYNTPEGSYSTVDTITFDKDDFADYGIKCAINVTPILPDGTVIGGGQEGLYDYIAGKLKDGEKLEDLDIFLGAYDSVEKAVEAAERLHELQQDFYGASKSLSQDSIDALSQLVNVINDTDTNTAFIDFEQLKIAAKEAGYTDEAINTLITTLEEYGDKVVDLKISEEDPLGLAGIKENVDAAINYLNALSIEATKVGENIQIDLPSFISLMELSGWKVEDIQAYINSLATYGYTFGENGVEVKVTTNADEISEKVNNLYTEAQNAPDEEIKVDLTGNAEDCLKSITDYLSNLTNKEHTITVNEVTNKRTNYSWGFGEANGTANAYGSAFASGNWGTKKSETALVGELGQELVVDPKSGTWHTVGDNGAEFTNIPKGSIVFNHKQTEDLLSKGYITGRGKAYASGTAYADSRDSGVMGSKYTRYSPTAQEEYNEEKKAQQLAKQVLQRSLNAAKEWVKSKNPAPDALKNNPGSTANGNLTGKDAGKKSGSSSSKDDSKQSIDFIEIKLKEIEDIISKTTAALENFLDDTSAIAEKNDAYDKLVKAEKEKSSTYFQAAEYYNKKATELLQKVPKEYREKAQNGAIDIKDFVGENQGKIADAIQEYRDMADKADDAQVNYLESIAEISAKRLEQLKDIADDFDNITGLIDSQSSLIQANMDLIEESGGRLSANYYDTLIKNTENKIKDLNDKKDRLEQDLKKAVSAGDITKGSNDWYEAIDLINSVDEELIQCNIDIEEFQNSINDLKWDALDKLISRFDHIDSQLSHLYDRLTDGKVVDDNGEWNSKGIAAMGMLAQQMELAKAQSDQYAKAINDLNKDYKQGKYSTDEYNEKLAELTEKQWDSIEAYESAKDKIVDLNKTRVDAIKDGLDKELDAYKKLIDEKKKLLDSEKDLYNFEKNVKEKEKNISDIERRLAALGGDTSMAAMAERKRLEAELTEAKGELEDLYYERSIDNQQNALDEEASSYEEHINKRKEDLDAYLENEEQVIADSMQTVKTNADTVLSEINGISAEYGIKISGEIVKPWNDGVNAVSGFTDNFKVAASSFMEQINLIIEQEKALEEQAKKTAQALLGSLSSGDPITFDNSYDGGGDKGYHFDYSKSSGGGT